MSACDTLDGLADGIVADLVECQAMFDLADLTRAGDKQPDCLTADQLAALDRSMGGPNNSRGKQRCSDWPYDGGMGGQGYRIRKSASPVPTWGFSPITPFGLAPEAQPYGHEFYAPRSGPCRGRFGFLRNTA